MSAEDDLYMADTDIVAPRPKSLDAEFSIVPLSSNGNGSGNASSQQKQDDIYETVDRSAVTGVSKSPSVGNNLDTNPEPPAIPPKRNSLAPLESSQRDQSQFDVNQYENSQIFPAKSTDGRTGQAQVQITQTQQAPQPQQGQISSTFVNSENDTYSLPQTVNPNGASNEPHTVIELPRRKSAGVNPLALLDLRVFILAHLICFGWANFVSFGTSTYYFVNLVVSALGIIVVLLRNHVEAMLIFMCYLLFSIVSDITFLSVFGKNLRFMSESEFALAMAIINLILKPFTLVYCYFDYKKRINNAGSTSDKN